MTTNRRQLFGSWRRRKGLSIIPEESETSRKNSCVNPDAKHQSHLRSLSISLRSKSSEQQLAESENRALDGDNGPTTTVPIDDRTEVTSAVPMRSKSKSIRRELRRALAIIAPRKSKKDESIEKEKEKEEGEIAKAKLEFGSTFDLSSVIRCARRTPETDQLANFLLPAATTAAEMSRRRRDLVKSVALSRHSIIDMSGADWDVNRFYHGDLVTKDIYTMEGQWPMPVAEPEASRGFFGTYDGSRTTQRGCGQPVGHWDTGAGVERVDTSLLPRVPERSPLRGSCPGTARTGTRPTSEEDLSEESQTPESVDQEPPGQTGTNPDEREEVSFEGVGAKWTVLERTRALLPRTRHDSGETSDRENENLATVLT
ncbi:hypothetical protein K458DRAFT_402394 [Lentithecium fluviatile CBS 122367]|uniref:Uncharacterized protein n=1 Tax=Lentithecium fluviatile CBS 122367 TaxID=1168545 RepID=A0A6G1J8V1_9PLEO|nr:hypothetical protein K458DRAFT_402394 [Lentithecium fluviatile CBS 122367]